MNKKMALFALSAVLCLLYILIPSPLKAAEIKSDKNVYLAKEETITGGMYAAASDITVDGQIEGDLIAAAQTITVNGRINGDLIAIAQTIIINGEINGNIRIAANSAAVNGKIARNLNFIGNTLSLGSVSQIGWDCLAAANSVNAAGTVQGNMEIAAETMLLSGKTGKDLAFNRKNNRGHLTIIRGAVINGNLSYNEKTQLSRQEEVQISGESQIIPVQEKQHRSAASYLWSIFYSIFSMLIVAMALIGISKKGLINMELKIKERPLGSLAWGLLAILALPGASLILAISIIGLPLALIGLLIFLASLYLGKIAAAIFAGRYLIQKYGKGKNSWLLSALIALPLAGLLFAIPYIGWLISLTASCIGFGSLILIISAKERA